MAAPVPTPPAPQVAVEEPEVVQEAIEPEPGPDISVARLMGLRESLTERVPIEGDDRDTLRLGQPPATGRPENWQPGTGAEAVAPLENMFNGKTVPADVEIVDRWQAADGSHNVVVETPAGLRMCGRAEAWDPARPLVEPVMMFRVCGGDGKRGFRFKPRERLNRDFIDSMAKDATPP